MKTVRILIAISLILGICSHVYAIDPKPGKNSVSYLSEGTKISGHLYLPKDYADGQKRPAIVIQCPASGVKEQTAGIYADKLSQKGFITLAFDPRGFGESDGHPLLLDPFRIAGDVRASVSFIRTLEQVDANKVFNMGLCAGAGMSAFATAFDPRVKAQVMVSPYLTTADDFLKMVGGSTAVLRKAVMPPTGMGLQKYFETGEIVLFKMVPETEEEIKRAQGRPVALGMREYYLPGKPGDVQTWKNGLSACSGATMLGFSVYNYVHMFDAVPVYMVYGSKAVSSPGAIKLYEALKGPKERLVVEGSGHFELYWKPEYVDPAVDGISDFLNRQIQQAAQAKPAGA